MTDEQVLGLLGLVEVTEGEWQAYRVNASPTSTALVQMGRPNDPTGAENWSPTAEDLIVLSVAKRALALVAKLTVAGACVDESIHAQAVQLLAEVRSRGATTLALKAKLAQGAGL